MNINININIDDKSLQNLFVGALEGGSNYWYYLPDHFDVPKGECLSTWIFEQVMNNNLQVKVHDTEDEESFLGWINKYNILTGIQLMADKYKNHFSDFISERDDATTADVFLQLVVLKKIVYG